jgi:hypothetical protein
MIVKQLNANHRGVFCGLLILGGGFLYLVDCVIAFALKIHPELPWFERGIYTGPSFQMTVIYMICILCIIFIKNR